MDRVAAKIAQKILMFFNDDRIDARAGQKQAQHHSAVRATMQHRQERICGVSSIARLP